MTSFAHRALLAAAVATTVLVWASSFVVIRYIGTDLSPGALALGRVAVAAVVLSPFVLSRRRPRLRPGRRLVVPVAAYAVMWFAGYNVALNAAERHVDAATAALVVNLAPLLIAVGAGALLREGLRPLVLAGSLVGLAGVALMSLPARESGAGSGALLGLGLGVLAACLYAAAVLVQKARLVEVDAMVVTWLGCLVGTLVLLPFAPQLVSELPRASPAAVAGMVHLGVLSTALGFTTWAYALRRTSASRLSPVGYLVTLTALLLSWLVLGEVPAPLVLVGGGVCLLGVVLTRWDGKRASRRSCGGARLEGAGEQAERVLGR